MATPDDPLLPAAPVEAFLDAEGLGRGPLTARRIGEGRSNVTFLVVREGLRAVLRRPPSPPLPPSAHDVVREARLQQGLGGVGARVPAILAVCEDATPLGVPFYVMAEVVGDVVTDRLPPALDDPHGRDALAEELVATLVELHRTDWQAAGLGTLGRPEGYLARQVRRFGGLWEVNATRALPGVERIGAWLADNVPVSPPPTVVHGDYRLGNVVVGRAAPARVLAVLDWELATIGDPLADLGYLVATWTEAGGAPSPLDLSPVTRRAGFPDRAGLARRYAERTGADLAALPWYRCLALWKAAIFCEAIHGRYLRGERSDAWAADLATGVPALVAAADAARACR